MSAFIGLQYLLIIGILLQFMPQRDELRYEIGKNIEDGTFILTLSAILLLLVLWSSFSRCGFFLVETLNLLLGIFIGALFICIGEFILMLLGIFIFLLFTWHFWAYLIITNKAEKKYEAHHISEMAKEAAKYRNEHQGMFHNDDEE
jgi:predicted membrane protein